MGHGFCLSEKSTRASWIEYHVRVSGKTHSLNDDVPALKIIVLVRTLHEFHGLTIDDRAIRLRLAENDSIVRRHRDTSIFWMNGRLNTNWAFDFIAPLS